MPTGSEPEASPAETPREVSFVDDLIGNMDADQNDDTEAFEEAPVIAPEPVVAAPAAPAPAATPQPAVVPPVSAPAVAPAVAQPAQVSGQPGAPAPAPVTPAAVVATPPAPAATPQGQPGTQPAAPGTELQALAQGLEAQRDKFVETAAQSYVQTFSDADIEAMQSTDLPAAKLATAKMAARLHADIVQNVLGIMGQQVPAMVARMQVVTSQQQRATEDFYTANPELRSHDAAVKQIAAGLRQANPNMPQETFIPMLVAMARQYAGAAAPVQPVQQLQPQVQPQRALPFQPAPARAAPRSGPAPAANGNQWGLISEIIEAEDQGRFEPR